MSKVYTKSGDAGMTSLMNGERVPKDDIRIELNGEIDELVCFIGLVKSTLLDDDLTKTLLENIQQMLMTIMGNIASGKDLNDDKCREIDSCIAQMEAEMDKRSVNIPSVFVIPGKDQWT